MRLLPRRRQTATVADVSPIRLAFEAPSDDARRRVLILVLGIPAAEMGAVLSLAERSLDPRRDVAVYVVSDLDVSVLRARGVLFEVLPDPSALKAGSPAAWRRYVERKFDLVRLKWAPASEIDLGRPLAAFLADGAADRTPA